MSGAADFTDIELHAYIDGALDAERHATIAARIENDPALAARVAAFRADKDMLKQVYGPLGDKPVPESWIARARSAPPPRTVSFRLVGSIAAALLVGILGTLTVQSLQHTQQSGIIEAALDARQTAVGARQAIDVRPGMDARQFDRAISEIVKASVKVPDMGNLGFRLVGVRYYQDAAELRYRNEQGNLLTLYMRKSDGAKPFRQFEHNGLQVCLWQDDVVAWVMTGDVSVAEMQRLAGHAYDNL